MLKITPVPAFNDNYIWLLEQPGATGTVVIDPGQAEPVLNILKEKSLTLEAILITHHHKDHTGGIDELLAHYSVPVYGPDNPSIGSISQPLYEGDEVTLLDTNFAVLEVPGHTLDHIAYVSKNPVQPLLFCGDSLFSAGCGRLFEGDASQMYRSLQKYMQLLPQTLVYPTHEYTLANLEFALAVEPANKRLCDYQITCKKLRQDDKPTLPTTLALEQAINPFLRSAEASVKHSVSTHFGMSYERDEDVFRQTRIWKDNF